MKLLHNYVVVKLNVKQESDQMTDSGLFIPATKMIETAGGSFKDTIDEDASYLNIGTVVAMSDKVEKEYGELGLKVGSSVRVAKVATPKQHGFIMAGESDHNGHILINSGLIESIEE